MSRPSKLKLLAEDLWTLSAEEIEALGPVMEKIVEAKRLVDEIDERLRGQAEEDQDRRAAEMLREVREVLGNAEVTLSGPESVILACYSLQEEGQELLESRRLNVFLESFERKPANSSNIVEKLAGRGVLAVQDEGPHSHKKFSLTAAGRQEAWDLLARLRKAHPQVSLSVVG